MPQESPKNQCESVAVEETTALSLSPSTEAQHSERAQEAIRGESIASEKAKWPEPVRTGRGMERNIKETDLHRKYFREHLALSIFADTRT